MVFVLHHVKESSCTDRVQVDSYSQSQLSDKVDHLAGAQ